LRVDIFIIISLVANGDIWYTSVYQEII